VSYSRIAVLLVLLLSIADRSSAQEEMRIPPGRLEYHLIGGLPSGLAGGLRYRIENISVEASVGTYFSALVYTAGFNVHRSLEREESHPTISVLGSYFKRKGDWYNFSMMLGILSLTKRELHSSIRGGMSFLIGRPVQSDRKFRVIPLPALELGIGYTVW
jgi:hypothetical protein